jgi:hypothetical protein
MTVQDNVPDIVLWVGHSFYPTADDYIKEAMNLGCSKRVPNLPEDVVPGKSRVFLAHDDGQKGHGKIFGFFTLSGVEVILDDAARIQQYEEQYKSLNLQIISTVQAANEPKRLCGQRYGGAFYLVSGSDTDLAYAAAKDLAGKCDIKGNLVILLYPIDYPRLRFRGWRYMEPQFLEKYNWPQKTLPVKRSVRVEPANPKYKDLPLLKGLEESDGRED